MTSALVIGGTGPTGPTVVAGLLMRGYEVTLLHTGQHELDEMTLVPHIHADPHFGESLSEALTGLTFDLVVAQYGRLRMVADVLVGVTERVIAAGGATAASAAPDDPVWGGLGMPAIVNEESNIQESDPERNKFGYRMAEAESALFRHHRAGHYVATYLAYPILYGPRQPGPQDWSIVRRILDGRKHMIVPDGGLKIESRCFTLNAAHALLLAVDTPDIAAGRKYLVGDDRQHTLRQRIEFIADYLGYELELVDMPYDIAKPAYPLWRNGRGHRIRETHRIKQELGYMDPTSTEEALRLTVDWLVERHPESLAEEETQLGDPFDYKTEDLIIGEWRRARAAMRSIPYDLPPPAHVYRHPKRPGETWSRPSGVTNPTW